MGGHEKEEVIDASLTSLFSKLLDYEIEIKLYRKLKVDDFH